ncbi:MAG: hypothetical protein HYZ26_00275 [Chloroflexi bacterium]|nr:hypothetical protein [Chloroflexota bacterium]
MDARPSMPPLLLVTGIVLTEWLLIVAEITQDFQYYLWGFLAVVAWSEAVHARNPRLYPNRPFRIFFFSMAFLGLLAFNKAIVFVQQGGLPVP